MPVLIGTIEAWHGPYCADCADAVLDANDHLDLDCDEITADEARTWANTCVRCGVWF